MLISWRAIPVDAQLDKSDIMVRGYIKSERRVLRQTEMDRVK
jgi:hypothetical protein